VGIEGSVVYATDNETGLAVGYGITNADGSFTIPELAPGTYTVTVDKIDYDPMTSSASPKYDQLGNPVPADVSLNLTVTAMSEEPVVPIGFFLEQNYPNPFNPTTNILFSISQTEKFTLTVYNILGQKIATLVEGVLQAGLHKVTWDGRDAHGRQLPSGVYLYRLSGSQFSQVRKMVLLK
jgi:hypothetical protein